jgi:hypothetical protein
MQAQPIQETVTKYNRSHQAIVMLKLVSAPDYDAKKLFLQGETLFASSIEKPVSFMDHCESIHISSGKNWKPSIESWKSRNGKKIYFFQLERSTQGEF